MFTLMSGNTLGMRAWTDGMEFAPMLAHAPAVAKCGHCQKCYWVSSAKHVGEIGGWFADPDTPVDPGWAATEDITEPDVEDYLVAIDEGLAADVAQERTLRVFAWWAGNRWFRSLGPDQPGDSLLVHPTHWTNLRALATLLREHEEGERVMKAEVLRELGDFAAALRLLDTVAGSEYASVVAQLRTLCERQDRWVRELEVSE